MKKLILLNSALLAIMLPPVEAEIPGWEKEPCFVEDTSLAKLQESPVLKECVQKKPTAADRSVYHDRLAVPVQAPASEAVGIQANEDVKLSLKKQLEEIKMRLEGLTKVIRSELSEPALSRLKSEYLIPYTKEEAKILANTIPGSLEEVQGILKIKELKLAAVRKALKHSRTKMRIRFPRVLQEFASKLGFDRV